MLGKSRLEISIHKQVLQHYQNSQLVKAYRVSTAKNGSGNQMGSYQTPLGLHYIKEKIGENYKAFEVFIGRQAQGNFFDLKQQEKKLPEDIITSRILWLSGKEAGINLGGEVDSYQRYIYIHGTNDEKNIGQAVSHGCVRMLNKDVIELFSQIEVGCEVLIKE